MKITDVWKNRDKPTLSCELFPPRDGKAAGKLAKGPASWPRSSRTSSR